MEELWDDYLLYLLWRCNLQENKKYNRLFHILHEIPFVYVLERDGNRSDDGIELRDDYDILEEYKNYFEEFMNRDCSVLEMLIALAIRVDDDIIGDPAEEHPEKFFLEMIENLGLDVFWGNAYMFDDQKVEKILDKWMYRRFNKNGRGSPFPVKNDKRDQRELEIWDQVNSYINENYCL